MNLNKYLGCHVRVLDELTLRKKAYHSYPDRVILRRGLNSTPFGMFSLCGKVGQVVGYDEFGRLIINFHEGEDTVYHIDYAAVAVVWQCPIKFARHVTNISDILRPTPDGFTLILPWGKLKHD